VDTGRMWWTQGGCGGHREDEVDTGRMWWTQGDLNSELDTVG
jgi:hypothetical protein